MVCGGEGRYVRSERLAIGNIDRFRLRDTLPRTCIECEVQYVQNV